MTSAADPANFSSSGSQLARAPEASRLVFRSLQSMLCVVLVLVVFCIWFAPDAIWMQHGILIKVCASILAAGGAFACLHCALQPASPKIEVDTIMHEVRLVRTCGRDRFVLDRCAFRDLSSVINAGSHVQLWGPNKTLVAEVPASDHVSHCSLITALRVAGKL